jgi:hypothetical protein
MDQEKLSTQTLTFGILGLVFAGGLVLGIIFSAIGLNKAKAYVEQFGELTGKAKVGRILAKVGLILSIIMAAFWVLYIILIAVGAANGMLN